MASAASSGISERCRRPFPLLVGGPRADVLRPVALQEPRPRARPIGEFIFPFCELSPINVGILWAGGETGNYPLFLQETESSPVRGARRASPPACRAGPGKGLLLREQVSGREQRFSPQGTQLSMGEIPLWSAGTAGGAEGTELGAGLG